jgi:antitoxin component of MazEF toxin-antitoxin module
MPSLDSPSFPIRARLSLPAAFCKAVGLEDGGKVIVELDGIEMRTLTQTRAITRAQALYEQALGGKPGMSVDEFISERHREPAREEAEYERWKAARRRAVRLSVCWRGKASRRRELRRCSNRSR